MTSKILIASALVLALVALSECGGGGHGGGGHKHVVIYVPIKHTNVHTKKIVTKHIRITSADDGEVVSHGGEGGDAFSHGKVSGSIHIGEPTYSHGSSHGWH
ncbi:uncharacterized protein LOC109536098 [Dendroctonus ponderosae]|uniref:DUF4766 domain-containing protein n=1 Tax=Dendroctonus ponderosae TaxID=77166 RepID=A0AAR5P9H4_DENPD|nr:uncharacterized protein LOC109536098 [Dendroctonus ponderosae]